MGWNYGWAPYVPVAVRRARAMKKMETMRKKGVDVQPVSIDGRKIAKTFWGEGWCNHLEAFSDFENRLPRGRTYVRNGSVCHLAVAKGKIEAKVSGSELYTVEVAIKTLPPKKWKSIKGRCSGRIGSLLELLQGRLSDEVMGVVTDQKEGLFPLPGEMSFKCSCPDWASMCKHVAAVLYGVGARLDAKPELLFLLRGVHHDELIAANAEKAVTAATTRGKSKRLAAAAVSDVFGIELDAAAAPSAAAKQLPVKTRPKRRVAAAKPRALRAKRSVPGAGTRGPSLHRAPTGRRNAAGRQDSREKGPDRAVRRRPPGRRTTSRQRRQTPRPPGAILRGIADRMSRSLHVKPRPLVAASAIPPYNDPARERSGVCRPDFGLPPS